MFLIRCVGAEEEKTPQSGPNVSYHIGSTTVIPIQLPQLLCSHVPRHRDTNRYVCMPKTHTIGT